MKSVEYLIQLDRCLTYIMISFVCKKQQNIGTAKYDFTHINNYFITFYKCVLRYQHFITLSDVCTTFCDISTSYKCRLQDQIRLGDDVI